MTSTTEEGRRSVDSAREPNERRKRRTNDRRKIEEMKTLLFRFMHEAVFVNGKLHCVLVSFTEGFDTLIENGKKFERKFFRDETKNTIDHVFIKRSDKIIRQFINEEIETALGFVGSTEPICCFIALSPDDFIFTIKENIESLDFLFHIVVIPLDGVAVGDLIVRKDFARKELLFTF